jgi:hypothetical protein
VGERPSNVKRGPHRQTARRGVHPLGTADRYVQPTTDEANIRVLFVFITFRVAVRLPGLRLSVQATR